MGAAAEDLHGLGQVGGVGQEGGQLSRAEVVDDIAQRDRVSAPSSFCQSLGGVVWLGQAEDE